MSHTLPMVPYAFLCSLPGDAEFVTDVFLWSDMCSHKIDQFPYAFFVFALQHGLSACYLLHLQMCLMNSPIGFTAFNTAFPTSMFSNLTFDRKILEPQRSRLAGEF